MKKKWNKIITLMKIKVMFNKNKISNKLIKREIKTNIMNIRFIMLIILYLQSKKLILKYKNFFNKLKNFSAKNKIYNQNHQNYKLMI